MARSGTQKESTATGPWPTHGGLDADVVVVGGGLAGLTAAAFAARAGASVILLERSQEVGGRAATHQSQGFSFNIGPHALYDGGAAATAFAELGVGYTGRKPPVSGGLAYHGGSLHGLPGGFVSLLTTDLLSLAGKLELAKALGSLGKVDAGALRGQSLRQWLDATFRDDVVRGLIEALMRLTAYANAPELSCAAASVTQLQAGMGKGVLYLDGGWATLARELRRVAEKAGARLETACRARRVRCAADHTEVVLHPVSGESSARTMLSQSFENAEESAADESRILRARVVVLALPPAVAAGLTEGDAGTALAAWSDAATPVKAACLDLGLERLPDPRRLFALGIDKPLYFSVHSASARLAPEGGALVHVAKYLPPGRHDAGAVEDELEAFCDLVQPGWRDHVVERRFLPSMLVTGALAASGRERPGPKVPGSPRLLVAGDWVGDEGMIADAAVASGRRAGELAVRFAAGRANDLAARDSVMADAPALHATTIPQAGAR